MSDHKDLRKALRARRRAELRGRRGHDPDSQPQTAGDPNGGAGAIHFRRDLARKAVAATRPARAGPRVELDEAVDGREVEAPGGGKAFLIENRLRDMPRRWDELCEAFSAAFADPRSNLCRRLAEYRPTDDLSPADVIFLDVETTGLASSPLFLTGVMVWEDGSLVARQYFARDYSQEGAVLSLFMADAAGKKLLVTFNGKTFDLPYVRVRSAATGIAFAVDAAHFDLLHVCRRIWKNSLPDCKLQTLERHICGRIRDDDIPSCQIPDAYHAYVHTGSAAEMVQCIKHNMLDLITMADLMVRLPPP